MTDSDGKTINYRKIAESIRRHLKDSSVDLHAEVAKDVFSTETPTKEQRAAVKEASFRFLYDGGPASVFHHLYGGDEETSND